MHCSLLEFGGAGYKQHTQIDMEEADYQQKKLIQKIVYCVENDEWSVQTYNEHSGFSVVSAPSLPNYVKYRM